VGHVPVRQVLIKFVRRNRRKFAAAGAAVAIVLTIAGLAQWAHNSHLRAEQERQTREEAQLAAQTADKQRQQAQVVARVAVFREGESNTHAREVVTKRLENVSTAEKKWDVAYREYYAARKYRHAIYAFTDAINDGYENHQVYYFRGISHAVFDEDQEALADFDQAIQFKPDFGLAYLNRALLYASSPSRSPVLKNLTKALEEIETALRYRPSDEARDAGVFYHDAAKVYAQASIAEADPNQAQTLMDTAEKYLRKAVELGQTPELIRQRLDVDRYKLLQPLLEQPSMRQFLAEQEKMHPPPSP
jgi:tetratricopeptide (TPR) repeat protein